MIYGLNVYLLKASLRDLYHHDNYFNYVHRHSNNKTIWMNPNEIPPVSRQGQKNHSCCNYSNY